MDRFMNSKNEKEAIYKIYRACRLCGAGAGYKMPIIQNVVDLDGSDVELKQKIRECVQIEVHQDDKMPPLICELCVDKVNDFYEFLDMCRQTNKRTRLRLGLPPQTLPQGAPDAGDCILGVTEPVYINDDDEPLSKQRTKSQKSVKIKKEPEVRIKIENVHSYRESRSSSGSRAGGAAARSARSAPGAHAAHGARRPPSPRRARPTRNTPRDSDDVTLSRLQQDTKKTQKTLPKGILKKEVSKSEDTSSLLMPRVLKRQRDKEALKPPTPPKKVKITTRQLASRSPKRPASPPCPYQCVVCVQQWFRTVQALSNHMRTHVANYTNNKLACNACGEWFTSADEARLHHRQHWLNNEPYNCRRCTADFKHYQAYTEHFDKNLCIPWTEEPEVQCAECWRYFVTDNLRRQHKCMGEEGRPGGKCSKCNRNYTTLKTLKKHENSCTAKKKGELIVDPELLGRLKPIQVRVARCDPLLGHIKQEHYDVSTVTPDFGLDRNCVYPYISSVTSIRIKTEPSTGEYDSMVNIKQEIKEEFDCDEGYIHWDSDSNSDSEEEVTSNVVLNPFAKKRVDSLSTLSLKTIFSQRFLGKVPRKRRKVKMEKENAFDSLFNTEFEADVRRGIDNIIDNLSDDRIDQTDNIQSVEDQSELGNVNQSVSDDIGDGEVQESDDKDKESETVAGDRNVEMVENAGACDEKIGDQDKSLNSDGGDEIGDGQNVDQGNTSEGNETETNGVDQSQENDPKELESQINDESDDKNNERDSSRGKDMEVDESREIGEPCADLKNNDTSDRNGDVSLTNDVDTVNDSKHESVDNIGNDSIEELLKSEASIEEKQSVNNHGILIAKYLEDKTEVPRDAEMKDSDSVTVKNPNEINEYANSDVNVTSDDKNVLNGESVKSLDKFNIDDLEDVSETEMDDGKLMEALDAQIGEQNNPERRQEVASLKENDKEDKITLEDLLPDKNEKSLELDSISGEFTFDT